MLAEVNTSRPPIENGALSASWIRNAMALACCVVAEPVQQNRELVAAQPGERVALPQARLEPARHRDQQLVADQVAEAVVDDLEAIEIEIEHREPAAAAPLLELVEPAPEPLDEHRAVAQPGQRIEEADAAQPLLRDRLLGRVGQRSGDADRRAGRAAHRDAAAQEPAVGAVLVADPVLVLEVIGLCRRDAPRAPP